MSKKKNKISNPLSGIPTKSLIITLVMILLCITCGFGFGYCARGLDDDQRENQAVTAYADSYILSDETYTTYRGQQLYPSPFDGRDLVYGFQISVLNHDLVSYPEGFLVPVRFNPLRFVNGSWVETVNPLLIYYRDLIGVNEASYSIGFEFYDPSTTSYVTVITATLRVFADFSIGTLEDDFEFLRCDFGTYGFKFVYSNGFILYVSLISNTSVGFEQQINFFSNSFYNLNASAVTVDAYNRGLEQGLLRGQADLEDLVREARLEGYNNGLTEGEEIGYQRGLDIALEDISPFNVIVSGVNSFLRTEILPGVQLTIILSVGFGLLLLGFAIKIFLGG